MASQLHYGASGSRRSALDAYARYQSPANKLLAQLECGMFALRMGRVGFLEWAKHQGLSRAGLYALADELSDNEAGNQTHTDKQWKRIAVAQSRLLKRCGIDDDEIDALRPEDRQHYFMLDRQLEARLAEMQAQELGSLGFEHLAALLLRDKEIYDDLVRSGRREVGR